MALCAAVEKEYVLGCALSRVVNESLPTTLPLRLQQPIRIFFRCLLFCLSLVVSCAQIIDVRVKQLQEKHPQNLYFDSSFFGFLCPTTEKVRGADKTHGNGGGTKGREGYVYLACGRT